MNRSLPVTIFEYKNYLSLRFQRCVLHFMNPTLRIVVQLSRPCPFPSMGNSKQIQRILHRSERPIGSKFLLVFHENPLKLRHLSNERVSDARNLQVFRNHYIHTL